MKALGQHYLLECYGCDVDILNDVHKVEQFMLQAAEAAKATILKSVFHEFFPHGISGVIVIAESHLTIHTWPEHGYAAIDVFVCGEDADPQVACDVSAQALGATKTHLLSFQRGISEDQPPHVTIHSNIPAKKDIHRSTMNSEPQT